MSQNAIHGSKSGVFINGYNLTDDFDEISFEAMQESLPRNSFGHASQVKMAGLKDGKVTGGGWVDRLAATSSLPVLVTLYTGGHAGVPNPATITRSINSSTFAIGSILEMAYTEEASIGFPVKINELEKFTLQGEVQDDGIDHGISLHTLGAETSLPFTGTAVDNTVATANGGLFVVHVTLIAGGAPNVVIKVQHSTDNSTYIDLATSTAVTAANSVRRVEVAAGVTVRRYLKVIATEGGTTTSVTFMAGFARR